MKITGVPSSVGTAELARELKIPLRDLDEVDHLDINLDGADEIDPQFRMIKGRGGRCSARRSSPSPPCTASR